MTAEDVQQLQQMNTLYSFVFPILLSIIGVVGMFIVKILWDVNKNLTLIRIQVAAEVTRHDSMEKNHGELKSDHNDLEKRVLQLETKKR